MLLITITDVYNKGYISLVPTSKRKKYLTNTPVQGFEVLMAVTGLLSFGHMVWYNTTSILEETGCLYSSTLMIKEAGSLKGW
jgi:hypothetical protein